MQTYKTVAELVDFLEICDRQIKNFRRGHTANLLAAASIDLYNRKKNKKRQAMTTSALGRAHAAAADML